jgi:hypothetical protein
MLLQFHEGRPTAVKSRQYDIWHVECLSGISEYKEFGVGVAFTRAAPWIENDEHYSLGALAARPLSGHAC